MEELKRKIIEVMNASIKDAESQRDEAYRNNDNADARYWGDNGEGRADMRRAVLKVLEGGGENE